MYEKFPDELEAWKERRDRQVKKREESLKEELESIFENDYFDFDRTLKTLSKAGWRAATTDGFNPRWSDWSKLRLSDFC